jgi:hypothetical protein
MGLLLASASSLGVDMYRMSYSEDVDTLAFLLEVSYEHCIILSLFCCVSLLTFCKATNKDWTQLGLSSLPCGSITLVATSTVAPDIKESGEPTRAPVESPTESGKSTPSTDETIKPTTSEPVTSSGSGWGLETELNGKESDPLHSTCFPLSRRRK